MVGRQSPLSVCLFSVFATMLPAMCERIHTDSLSSIPGKSRDFMCLFTGILFNNVMDSNDCGQIKWQDNIMSVSLNGL